MMPSLHGRPDVQFLLLTLETFQVKTPLHQAGGNYARIASIHGDLVHDLAAKLYRKDVASSVLYGWVQPCIWVK